MPAVQKLATGGYDGRGVQIIENLAAAENGFDEIDPDDIVHGEDDVEVGGEG